MKWFYMEGPGGTIAVKGHYAGAARAEAAERWSCSAEDIKVTGEEEYRERRLYDPYDEGISICGGEAD